MKKIMVIDDEAAVRTAVRLSLRDPSYTILEAASGEEGLEMAQAELPDLVLSDVTMTGMDGFAVLQGLRSRRETSGIPVILMTGRPEKADARFSMEQGADDYLIKPFTAKTLVASVQVRLQRQQMIQESAAANEGRLLELLSVTHDLIAIANPSNAQLLYLNPAGREMLAIGLEEDIENLKLADIIMVSGEGTGLQEQLAAVDRHGSWVGEGALTCRDGRRIPVSQQILAHRAAPDKGAYLSVVARDITGRLEAEQALRRSENRYRKLIESLGEGYVTADGEQRFTLANPAAERILAVPPGSLVGRTLHEFLDEKQQLLVREQVARRRSGEQSSYEIEIDTADGARRRILITATPQLDEAGRFVGSYAIFRDITERQQAEERLRLLTSALEATANGIVISDRRGRILWTNEAFSRLTGYSATEVVGRTPSLLKSGVHQRDFYAEMWQTILSGNVWQGELVNRRKDGQTYDEDMTITPVLDAEGEIRNFVAVKQEITERKRVERERRMMEVQLRQAQKLEAIGQLAAGIAHEINTPTQYVGDNTRFLQTSFESIGRILDSCEELLKAARNDAVTPELISHTEQVLADGDIDYLLEQIPAAIGETLEGVGRITKIVRAMKEFSHPSGEDKTPADLNKAIESTATVARNEWKYVADLKLELDPNLPSVPCFLGEFNQAILNLIINAAHAIGDVAKEKAGAKGVITLRTRRDGNAVEVSVADTGSGIPEAFRARIFEPFFTTKAVGKGTGQGLSIVYGCVVKKHGGTIRFETEVGKGTTFIMRLPLGLENGQPGLQAPSKEDPQPGPPAIDS